MTHTRRALGALALALVAVLATPHAADARPLEDVLKPTYDGGAWHNASGDVPACPSEDSCKLVLDEGGHWHVIPDTP